MQFFFEHERRRGLERDCFCRRVDVLDLNQFARQAIELQTVVADFDPLPVCKTQYIVGTHIMDADILSADVRDRCDDSTVIARPFEGRVVRRAVVRSTR